MCLLCNLQYDVNLMYIIVTLIQDDVNSTDILGYIVILM